MKKSTVYVCMTGGHITVANMRLRCTVIQDFMCLMCEPAYNTSSSYAADRLRDAWGRK